MGLHRFFFFACVAAKMHILSTALAHLFCRPLVFGSHYGETAFKEGLNSRCLLQQVQSSVAQNRVSGGNFNVKN